MKLSIRAFIFTVIISYICSCLGNLSAEEKGKASVPDLFATSKLTSDATKLADRWAVYFGADLILRDRTFNHIHLPVGYLDSSNAFDVSISGIYSGPTSYINNGNYFVGFRYFRSKKFSYGINLMYSNLEIKKRFDYDNHSAPIIKKRSTSIITFLPCLKYNYVNTDWFRCYVAVGWGFSVSTGDFNKYEIVDLSYSSKSGGRKTEIEGVYRISLFGVEVGKKIYAFSECNLGNVYAGLTFGIGYHF